MIGNALVVTVALLLALVFWLMGQLRFLVPYKRLLLERYGDFIFFWLGVLFANVFSAVYALQRKVFLKDTGRKLSHLDKQTITGGAPVPNPAHSIEKDLF